MMIEDDDRAHLHLPLGNIGGDTSQGLPMQKTTSASRFQVVKSDTEDTPTPTGSQSSREPSSEPAAHLLNGRKGSTAGRFVVSESFSNAEHLMDSDGTVAHENGDLPDGSEAGAGTAVVMGKYVHFEVGEENRRETPEHHRQYSPLRHDSIVAGDMTINQKSWRNMQTLDHPPIIDFYRNSIDIDGGVGNSRPSMAALIHGKTEIDPITEFEEFKTRTDEIFEGHGLESPLRSPEKIQKFVAPPSSAQRTKFGWIEGVFVRCLLNIFGVMLYLRISWVAGEAGILLGSLVVLVASTVTTITAISTCAICTNGDVKGGGAYYLISRSLGPEFGGSIGLIFSVANAVGAAMYVVGFAETVRDLLKEYGWQMIDELNDVRIIGIATCCVLMAVVFVGTSFESKMQLALLVILTLSLINYMIGTLLPVSDHQHARGVTGYSMSTLTENILPDFRDGHGFFSVFAIYFPAATGIMAGANISGDLTDPQKAIPKGTLLAIALTTVVYLAVVWMTGSTCVRYSNGVDIPIWLNETLAYARPACAVNNTCEFGLQTYPQVMELESAWGPLITAGIFAATLSSALASLVSAPKVFQAVCKDRLFPRIGIFAKGYGKNEEPRRAYGLAFIIALLIILIGELDKIAPIISNFFLASYALINYSCFDASFADSPGFRPGFKYYNMWMSLGGALLCISVMFIIDWATALVTFIFFAMLFLYILHRKPEVNWGSSTQAHSYKNALNAMIKLANTEDHVKNYRPQILVLTGNPVSRASLVDFVYNISKGSSLMICGYVVPLASCDRLYGRLQQMDVHMKEWLRKRHVKSFYTSVANPNLRSGTQSLIQIAGLGKLKPNLLILGFKANWRSLGSDGIDEINDYFGVIQDAFDNGMGVGVLRSGVGLDCSEMMQRHNVGDTARLRLPDVKPKPKGSSLHDSGVGVARTRNKADDDEDETPPSSSNRSPEAKKNSDHDLESAMPLLETDEEGDGNDRTLTMTDLPHIESSSSIAGNIPLETLIDEEDEDGNYNDPHEASDDYDEGVDVDDHEKPATDDDDKALTVLGPGEIEPRHSIDSNFKSRRFRQKRQPTVESGGSMRRPTAAQRELITTINRFQRKTKGGVIDVWWLYDDGGLTLLIPHLMTAPKSYLENARLRVFTISTSRGRMEQEQRNMATLLSKFRIDFADVNVIPDIARKPSAATVEEFQRMIAPFRMRNNGDSGKKEKDIEGLITDSELAAQLEKTNRQLRLSELLYEHSRDSNLVVLTLPVPRKGLISSSLYMAWLDMMTRRLPTTLFVRGNQQSVLTFYS